MNRRGFIKRGALWVPAIVGLKAYPQALTLADPAKVTSSPVALTCQPLVESTFDGDYYVSNTDLFQKIKFTGGEVCEIQLKMFWISGTDGKVKVQLWSSTSKTTQYGSDSNEITVTSASYFPAAWAAFTFATNPSPPGDFCIYLLNTGTNNVGWRCSASHAGSSTYYPYTDASDDAAYCTYAYGANAAAYDMTFKIYTMQ